MAETNTNKNNAAVSGAASTNAYGSENTKDYSKSITDQYAQYVKEHNDAVDGAVQGAEARLEEIQAVGDTTSDRNLSQAQRDRNEVRETRRAIEQNNGNRQQIGESQYGVAENAYDQQKAAIESYRKQLQTKVSRQVADLKAQGEYEQANAALQAAQAKFKQLYTEQLRLDTNLRGNYEYQTGLQREDADIARQQSSADRDWNRQLGEFMLSHGVVPGDSILTDMGLDADAAKLYANSIVGGYSGGGSSGGSGGSSGSGSGTAKGTDDTPSYETPASTPAEQSTSQAYNKAYSVSDANAILSYIKAGNYTAAYQRLASAYQAGNFSVQNMNSLYNMITSAKNKSTVQGSSSNSSSNKASNKSTVAAF